MFLPPGRNLVVRARFRFCMGKRSILRELRFVRERYQQRGRQSAAGPVGHGYVAVIEAGQVASDAQPQAGASGARVTRIFQAVKQLENVFEFVFGDARPVILDTDAGQFFPPRSTRSRLSSARSP